MGYFQTSRGSNGSKRDFWRTVELSKGGGELVQTKSVLFAQSFLPGTANPYISPEMTTRNSILWCGELRKMVRGG